MKDWKTTTAGVLTILAGFIGFVALPYLHGQPPNITGFITTVTGGMAGICARDSTKAAN